MNLSTALFIYLWLLGAQSVAQFTNSTRSSPKPTAPAILTPCGTGPPSCFVFEAIQGINIFAYANYTVTQTVASVTYNVTKYRDTTITNTITVLPTTTERLPQTDSICKLIPGGCGDVYHEVNFNYETTAVISGTTLTSGHAFIQVQTVTVANTGYKSVGADGITTCKTDGPLAGATDLPLVYTELFEITSKFDISTVNFPDQFISEIRKNPVYTNQYPEVLTCSFGGGGGAPLYQVLVTQLTATTTKVQSLDANYNIAAPVTSIPALPEATGVPPQNPAPATSPSIQYAPPVNTNPPANNPPANNPPANPPPANNPPANPPPANSPPANPPSLPESTQPVANPTPPVNVPATTAPSPAQPINPPNNAPGVVFVPTTIINPGALPVTSFMPVLFSPTTSINALGSPIITSIPIQGGTTTLINIPITSVDAAGNPVTSSSVVTAIILGGSTYLATTSAVSGPANPTAAPGSPGGPASIITFSGLGVPSVITIGSTVVTADSSSRFVIGGQTLTPGGAITISSSVISLATGVAGTGTGSAAGSGHDSVIISVLGGPTATATGTGSGTVAGGSRPSVVVTNQGTRKRINVVVMIEVVAVGAMLLGGM